MYARIAAQFQDLTNTLLDVIGSIHALGNPDGNMRLEGLEPPAY